MAFGKMIIFLLMFITFAFVFFAMGNAMILSHNDPNGYYNNNSLTTTANRSLLMTEQFMPYSINASANGNSSLYNISNPNSLTQTAPFTIVLVLIIIFAVLTFGAGLAFLLNKGK
jgi:ABC-type sugar transport system permease subunit